MRKHLTKNTIKTFITRVHRHYKDHARPFPWRRTSNPYHVFISEVMLQQTQTDRVVGYFNSFIKAFPDFTSLAHASFPRILKQWQGLGYNRRALYLQRAAQQVCTQYNGILPQDIEQLETLPGIGPATARSITAFAFNLPVVFIETNIRTVFIHEFFKDSPKVSDDQLLPLIEATLDRKNPCRWYNALMDYGVMLKKNNPNPSRKSAHYVRQKPFEKSDRKIRGAILRLILKSGPLPLKKVSAQLPFPPERTQRCLSALADEKLITITRNRVAIAS